MSEAFEQQPLTPTVDADQIPSSYGDSEAEYAAIRKGGVGLIDLSARGRIRVTGSEAVLFLNGLITNDMKTLSEGSWMHAIFPNAQGRIIASVRMMRLADQEGGKAGIPTFLMDTEPVTHQRVMQTIERFTLAGDFHVRDLTSETAQFSLQGRSAAEWLREPLQQPGELAQGQRLSSATLNRTNVTLIHSTHTGEDGYDLVLDARETSTLWKSLISKGATPVGSVALETLRIEAGIPRFGVDIHESMVASETNLDEAISFTKGCYVGQEIIARIKHRGHVAKKLTGLVFDERVQVQDGVKVSSDDGKEIGSVTSSTFSPSLGRTVALALIRYQFLDPGTLVIIEVAGTEVPAKVAALPFISGSWRSDAQS